MKSRCVVEFLDTERDQLCGLWRAFWTLENTFRMKWTRHLCHAEPANTVSIAVISPVCAPAITSVTP